MESRKQNWKTVFQKIVKRFFLVLQIFQIHKHTISPIITIFITYELLTNLSIYCTHPYLSIYLLLTSIYLPHPHPYLLTYLSTTMTTFITIFSYLPLSSIFSILIYLYQHNLLTCTYG